MGIDDVNILAAKYMQGKATDAEIKQLHEWYDTINEGETELVVSERDLNEQQLGEEIFAGIHLQMTTGRNAKVVNMRNTGARRKWLVAAAVLLVLSTGYLLFKPGNKVTEQPGITAMVKDAMPGSNKAVLTLGDNTNIVLDSSINGNIAQQGNVAVVKQADGQLVYHATGKTGVVLYNTLQTPKGGQYKLMLPDGTMVWLNAASSIKYPTVFTGSSRTVEMTGEAYFEVAHKTGISFHVKVNGLDISDIGTHFNINAYADEKMVKATLLEGAIKVNNTLLMPGQQAQVTGDKIAVADNADVDEAVAWKNGFFQFNRADLPTVMRQLARWYDVDVSYEGNIPALEFGGAIERDLTLKQVLNILVKSQVKFKIEGKKLIITP
ncbi:MAG TPA: FecR domain-containing protein [Chitinophagaceae bacterium]|nr:FecR domain-containing protein [Chitinophagaceae bacterium]